MHLLDARSGRSAATRRTCRDTEGIDYYSGIRAGLLPSISTLKLSSLSIRVSELADLSFLRGMPPLEDISLNSLEQVADYSPMAAHSSARTLSLEGCRQLTDVSGFRSFDSLHTLGSLARDLHVDWLSC